MRLSLLSFTCFSSNVTEPIRIPQSQNLSSFVIKECLLSLMLSQQLLCSVCDSSNGHCIIPFGMRKCFVLLVIPDSHCWNFPVFLFQFMGFSPPSWCTLPTQLSLFVHIQKPHSSEGAERCEQDHWTHIDIFYTFWDTVYMQGRTPLHMSSLLVVSWKVVEVPAWPAFPFLYWFTIFFPLRYIKTNKVLHIVVSCVALWDLFHIFLTVLVVIS